MNRLKAWTVVVAAALAGCSDGGNTNPGSLLLTGIEEPGNRCPYGGTKIETGIDSDGNGLLTVGEINPEATVHICNGAPGILATVVAEPAGDNCDTGGQRVNTGRDEDADGELDDEEVTATSYVCDGADNTSTIEIESLLTLTDEPAGENCANGGERLQSGVDLDGDGALSEDEVDSSGYICNIEGVNSLINLVDEAPGANCVVGGQRLEVGIDANNDGALTSDEVQITEYLCDEGDVLVRVSAAPRDPYECLRGGIQVEVGQDADGDGVLADAEVTRVDATCNAAPYFVSDIASGGRHACALLSSQQLQCWGSDDFGQLGDGATDSSGPTPVGVRTIRDLLAVTAGLEHTCALHQDGGVYCWGNNTWGQLGDGNSSEAPLELHRPSNSVFAEEPVAVVGVSDVAQVVAGAHHTCALSGGQVFCWGWNQHGQLGKDASEDPNVAPEAVAGLSGVTAIAAGYYHTCAIDGAGQVYCWGRNDHGQLGDGSFSDSAVPVEAVGRTNTASITAGGSHTCATDRNGDGFCWGYNAEGQIGDGTTTDRSSSRDINNLTNLISVDAGPLHTCAALLSARAHCWGSDDHLQLGDGAASADQVNPATVDSIDPVTPDDPIEVLVEISAGGGGEQLDGTVDGTPEGDPIPFDPELVVSIAHTCARGSDGLAYCWGDNSQGQLGNGDAALTQSGSPVEVQLNFDP